MRRTTFIAAAALLLSAAAAPPASRPPVAAPAIPTRASAKMLSDLCAQDRGACLGYVVGSMDSWASALAAAGRPQVFCVPAAATNDQVTQTIVRFIRAHPEESGTNAGAVILAGLRTAFPCGY